MNADPRALHDAENVDFSAYLHTLTEDEWDKPSLCAGWLVRDVVGHILDGNELRLWTLPIRLARFGFSSNRSGKHHSIQRAAGRTPAELLDDFDARDPWAGTCRVFPARLVLLDRLVHHQDIRRALGHPRPIPEDRLRAVLDATPRLGSVFGARRRTRGLRFAATDLDWTWGDGPEVAGPGEALVMTMLGRKQAVAGLSGPGLATFAGRL
ncbi:MAG TPA: maleylpyruvate isomerase family mycothiol-dependent enzyme [Acidimicrobiales bacterium]|nr:maleylpyruvate isomerase family mycothiol-dependent enzyme [Acidimicrobiales bacterium]